MARPQLSSLLEPRGNEEDTVKVGEAPTPILEVEPARPAEPAVPAAQAIVDRPKREARAKAPKAPVESVPPYLRYERKESRLRTDQLTDLTLRARQLNKTKDTDSDRITDNTLIRIAVDLLLSRADELTGGDEAALRKSLGI
ncbi:MAG: hypothetical protein LCH77_12615 [Actinobacteria bacterium]|jgi:hypothetical protein|nr:hypothetical protein [Actinomycetota bacterium]